MIDHPHSPPSTPDADHSYQIPAPPSSGSPRSYNPTPPRKKSNSTFIIIVVGVVALGFFGLLALLLLGGIVIGGAAGSSKNFRESELEAGDSGKKVVIIPIHGIISSQTGLFGGSAGVAAIRERLEMTMDDPDVAAIILDVNTPGGEVTATDEIHHLIQKIRQEKKIVVITCMRSVAASGGYYLAAGTDHVIANRLTMTGSIGVVIGGINYSKLLEKIGVEGKTFKSGPMKDMGSPSRRTLDEIADLRLEMKRRIETLKNLNDQISKEEVELIRTRLEKLDKEEKIVRQESELIQKMVNECFAEFAKVVALGRNLPLETVLDTQGEIGNARIISGAEAHRLKLVDEIGFMEDAIAFARKSGNHRIVEYARVPNIFNALSGNVQADKISLVKELLPPEMRIIKKGRLYYLNPNLF